VGSGLDEFGKRAANARNIPGGRVNEFYPKLR